MRTFPYTLLEERLPTIGLIVLQADETIETDFRVAFPPEEAQVFVSRIASGADVTPETLAAMEADMTRAASLLPDIAFDTVAYACTSGTSVIGAETVHVKVRAGCQTTHVTDPVTALTAACRKRGISRLAFLSPYREDVNTTLREVLAREGIETPIFGSFDEMQEKKVARIDTASIVDAAIDLVQGEEVEAIFLSCTNLKTREAIPFIETKTGLAAMSSNSVLVEACGG
jgi:maleate isomerase